MGIQTALDAVRQADRLVHALRAAEELAFEASRDGGVRTIRILTSALGGEDQLAAIAATHALAQVIDEQADVALTRLLSSERGFLREHAAWVLGSRLPRVEGVARLVALVAEGGFSGMLAQRTLEQWSEAAPELVAVGIEGALIGVRKSAPRARLVETLGLVRRRIATRPLLRIAADRGEHAAVRTAAVAALGQRQGEQQVPIVLGELAAGSGALADVARLALVDLTATVVPQPDGQRGLTIAQLFLHADIDAGLTHAGSGDNGGIATLLVRLGDALVADRDAAEVPAVERVLTLSRGSAVEALESVAEIAQHASGHFTGRIPLLVEPTQSANAWPLRVVARRGIRRLLRAAGRVDVLHLRMADVGSLAAADVARELDIPVVFTVAPDPHGVIDSMDRSGRLTRWNFGDTDEVEHYWFRARLVQRLAANAAHSVLFPRPELERDMRELVGIDITEHPERHSIVPEGIDLGVVDRAVAEAAAAAAGAAPSAPLAELHALLERLPAERRGLPLLVTVGRMHRVKGMATIVEAWASGSLRARANLLVIGGDLVAPSADEREQLDRIDAVVSPDQRFTAGLLLAGHRPNDVVARWVAATRFGVPGFAAPRGVYVCGSLKEEFGIALLEGMASGLLVVAPDGGGPATYVEQGRTGVLTQTWDLDLLRSAMVAALDLAAAEIDDDRARFSREVVERSFTIQAMAASLGDVYEQVRDEERELAEWQVVGA
jgi:glycosyltransferase involved in cell wall biosynthesis